MPDSVTTSDHDILNTLVANVQNMKESQDNFHREMKESFADLKYNFAERLNKVESGLSNADRVFIAKVEQDKRDAGYNTRIVKLEFWQQKVIGALIILNAILGIILAYVTYHK